MSDITNVYRATVKALRSRHKSTAVDQSILKTRKKKGPFSSNAMRLLNEITEMRNVLFESRAAYINVSRHIGGGSREPSEMNDEERDRIDAQFHTFIEESMKSINNFKNTFDKNATKSQLSEHREQVYKLLKNYLLELSKVYEDLKTVRTKQHDDYKNMSQLKVKNHVKNAIRPLPPPPQATDSFSHAPYVGHAPYASPASSSISSLSPSSGYQVTHQDNNQMSFILEDSKQDVVLSQDDMQMLKQENETMMNDISLIFKEVDQVEQKVYEITKLQELISQNILQQVPCVNKIAETAVDTTENIKIGNEDIRQAMKNKAGVRVWILFFLLLCSFSLLFLDWYNP